MSNILAFVATVLLSGFGLFWIKQLFWKLSKLIFKKEDKFALDYVFSIIENDSNFISEARNIVLEANDLDDEEAEKIVNLPIVIEASEKAVQLGNAKFPNSNIVTVVTIKRSIKDILFTSWHNPKKINTVVNKIKAGIE